MHVILKNSLSAKFNIMVIMILLVTMSVVTIIDINSQYKIFLSNIETKTQTLGNFLSLISAEAIFSYDFDSMDDYMQEINQQEDIVFGIMLARNGSNLTSYLDKNNPYVKQAMSSDVNEDILSIIKKITQRNDVTQLSFDVTRGSREAGTILLGYSHERADQFFTTTLVKTFFENMAIILFVSVCLWLGFRNMAMKPLFRLRDALDRVASGDLTREVEVQSSDEIGELTACFNHMEQQLRLTLGENESITAVLKKQAEELLLVRDEAIAASRAKSNFLANMSHELRTPLNAIIGYSELLSEDMVEQQLESLLPDIGKISSSGHHLLKLINEILDLSKIEAGKMKLLVEEYSLDGFVADVITGVEPLFKKNGNTLELQIEKNIGYIKTDIVKAKQMIFNLLGNACKFTHNGSITFKVVLTKEQTGEWVIFTVSDTGIGMTSEQLTELYQPFTQGDSSALRKYGGTGLGLTITKRFCEMMGGHIQVISKLGEGSVFTLSLPMDVSLINNGNSEFSMVADL